MTKTEALETLAQVAWLALYEGNCKFDTDSLEEAIEQVGAIREALFRDGDGLNLAYYLSTRNEQSKSEG